MTLARKEGGIFCGVTFVGGTSIHVQLGVCQARFNVQHGETLAINPQNETLAGVAKWA